VLRTLAGMEQSLSKVIQLLNFSFPNSSNNH
jgi:hypothetical protein